MRGRKVAVKGSFHWQRESFKMSGLALEFRNGNESFKSRSRGLLLCLYPLVHRWTCTFTRLIKGLAWTDWLLYHYPSLWNIFWVVILFLFFSNLSLKRSIQYLIDGHPRVCNKVRTHIDGIWMAGLFSFAVKCNKKICKVREVQIICRG